MTEAHEFWFGRGLSPSQQTPSTEIDRLALQDLERDDLQGRFMRGRQSDLGRPRASIGAPNRKAPWGSMALSGIYPIEGRVGGVTEAALSKI